MKERRSSGMTKLDLLFSDVKRKIESQKALIEPAMDQLNLILGQLNADMEHVEEECGEYVCPASIREKDIRALVEEAKEIERAEILSAINTCMYVMPTGASVIEGLAHAASIIKARG